jgi:hypothetical protein
MKVIVRKKADDDLASIFQWIAHLWTHLPPLNDEQKILSVIQTRRG